MDIIVLKIWSKQQQQQILLYWLRNQHAQHIAFNVKHELKADIQMHCVRSGATLFGKALVAQKATPKTPIVFWHSNSAKRAANPGMELLMTLAVRSNCEHSQCTPRTASRRLLSSKYKSNGDEGGTGDCSGKHQPCNRACMLCKRSTSSPFTTCSCCCCTPICFSA